LYELFYPCQAVHDPPTVGLPAGWAVPIAIRDAAAALTRASHANGAPRSQHAVESFLHSQHFECLSVKMRGFAPMLDLSPQEHFSGKS